jgi:hypothetical protein
MEPDRIAQFKADLSDMRSTAGRSRVELRLELFGAVMMVAAAVTAFVAYEVSVNQSDPRNVQSDIVLAVAMLVVSVMGAALFVRYSIARFLRLWLLRQLYEGQANTERLVASLSTGGGAEHRRAVYGNGSHARLQGVRGRRALVGTARGRNSGR